MKTLKATSIYRGGATAPYLSKETNRCRFRIKPSDGAAEFSFSLASKGGGTTRVRLSVGFDDLQDIIIELIHVLPPQTRAYIDAANWNNRGSLEGFITEILRVMKTELEAQIKPL